MMDYVEIKEEKLDIELVTNLVTLPSCGAVSVFIGDSTLDIIIGLTEDRQPCWHVTRLLLVDVCSPSLKSICKSLSLCFLSQLWHEVFFKGTTRDNFSGKKVVRLEYEAYVPMAKKKILELCQMLRKSWKIGNTAIFHRIGLVPVSEASIIIAISSEHRKESLEALHFAIDTFKATVPIWKKEFFNDESSEWKYNKECCWIQSQDLIHA